MTRRYPDLSSASDWLNQISHAARPIRSTTQIWVVMRHQYGISALVSQTSFGGEISGSVAKCRLFSQAIEYLDFGEIYRSSLSKLTGLKVTGTMSRRFCCFRSILCWSLYLVPLPIHKMLGSFYVSRKLPTYPSPKPAFCPKWEVSVYVGLWEG